MEMPIDLTIDSEFGLRYNYHIPNKWFVKTEIIKEINVIIIF